MHTIVAKTLFSGADTSPLLRIRSRSTFLSTVVKVCCRSSHLEDGFTECLLISFRRERLGERCLFEHFIRKVGCITYCDDTLKIDDLSSSTNNRNILAETDETFYFPPGSLHYNQNNVITILQVSCIS